MDQNTISSSSAEKAGKTVQSEDYDLLELLNDYVKKNSGEGFLKFQVTSGIIPVEGAEIVISKNLGGNIYAGMTLTTDRDGKTETVRLPAPNKALSLSPGNELPYSSYDVRVSKDGYLDSIFYDVPVFEGITSIQSVVLKPDLDAPNVKYSEPVYEKSYENL